jgi:hypothetical protein
MKSIFEKLGLPNPTRAEWEELCKRHGSKIPYPFEAPRREH